MIMRRIFISFLLAISIFCTATAYAQHDKLAGIFSVTACPAENCENAINISWATDTSVKRTVVEITPVSDSEWKKSSFHLFESRLCTTYDSVYSKGPKGENFYEDVVINKYNASIAGLKADTRYKYRVYPLLCSNLADGAVVGENYISGIESKGKYSKCRELLCDTYHTGVRYFKTSGAKEWEACIISDFHVYSPIYGRTEAAMAMISTVEKYAGNNGETVREHESDSFPFDWILHLGDITAWGGSYSFWKNLYTEQPFKRYMWAGVNGNHDNMTRNYDRTTNEFFRDAAAYPMNGYEGEMGVCYHFRYGDVLFIMLNNENMRSDEGLAAAQKWVSKVVEENPAPYTVVCEHYQWFFGNDGKESQYSRWSKLFDELGVNLALAGNNHIYVSTPALYDGKPLGQVKSGKIEQNTTGTVYIQTPSSDNERGVAFDASVPLQYSADKIKFRWSEGPNTVGAMHMKVTPEKMVLTLLDRNGNVLDVTEVLPSR